MKRKVVWLAVSGIALIVLCGGLYADIIKFKDGTSIQGRIIAEMGDCVMIQLGDGKAHKISRQQIRDVIKGDLLKTGNEQPKKRRLRISDLQKLSIDKIKSDLDSWCDRLETVRLRSNKQLSKGLLAARVGKEGECLTWLIKWYETGLAAIALKDANSIRPIFQKALYVLRRSINGAGIKCSSCSGSNLRLCRKCRGRGKVRSGKTIVHSISKAGVTSRTKSVARICRDCKGSGKTVCSGESHIFTKLIKDIGGLEKAVEIERLFTKCNRELPCFVHEALKELDGKRLRELAERSHAVGCYYITLEILKRIEGKKKKE